MVRSGLSDGVTPEGVGRMVRIPLRRINFLLLIPEGVLLVVSPLKQQGLGIMAISKLAKLILYTRPCDLDGRYPITCT